MKEKPDFRRNQKVDGFILEEPLGAGQDGEVWRATKLSIRKNCAIKFLNSANEPEKKARFEREIEILASLSHPYIVQIQDKGEAWNPVSEEIVPYYVMEFLPGLPIHKALGEVPDEARLEAFCLLFGQVCSALDTAHAMGISHGDVKPANILVVGKERIAKLSDFGFGLLPGESKQPRTEYPDSSYRAPNTLTPAIADIFRLGRTLRECLDHFPQLGGTIGRRQIVSLATRMSESPADVTLAEATSVLDQVRTIIWGRHFFPEKVEDALPELSAGSNEGKLISDPVHGVRSFSLRTLRILDQPFFQRLREIRQFPSSSLVFPTLTISAFENTLGDHAMLIRQLESFARTSILSEILTPTQLSTTILAALLLDGTRMPFENAVIRGIFGDMPSVSHRANEFLQKPEISQIVIDEWKIEPEVVTRFLVDDEPHNTSHDSNAAWRLMYELLHGPFSASAVEWVFRASARVGFEAAVDINELLRSFTISEKGQVVVLDGRLRTLEAFVLARIQALERLVFHHTVRAADLMLEYAFALLRQDGLDFNELVGLNDFEFLKVCVDRAREKRNETAVELLTKYKNRVLHRRLLSISRTDIGSSYWRFRPSYSLAERIASRFASALRLSVAPGEFLVDVTYFHRRPDVLVLTKDGDVRHASSVSPGYAALQEWPTTQDVTIYTTDNLKRELNSRIKEAQFILTDLLRDVFADGDENPVF